MGKNKMKRNAILLYAMITFACIFSSIDAKGKQNVRPNVYDLKKSLKPIIQKPYKPIEVDSLIKGNQADKDIEMLNAEIVGVNQSQTQKGVEEKPSLYTTVVTPHATSIRHENESIMAGFNANGGSLSMLRKSQDEVRRLSKGQMAIPVSINSGMTKDAALSNYETPSFLNKKEKKISHKKAKKILRKLTRKPRRLIKNTKRNSLKNLR